MGSGGEGLNKPSEEGEKLTCQIRKSMWSGCSECFKLKPEINLKQSRRLI